MGDTFLTEVAGQTPTGGDRRASQALAAAASIDESGGFSRDIMMSLSTRNVSALHQEFDNSDDGLSVTEFVSVMTRFLHSSDVNPEDAAAVLGNDDETLVANLVELFEQIDVNGDGSMEWEEFTSFVVDQGLSNGAAQPDAISQYHPSPWLDVSKHSQYVEKLFYWQGLDRIAAVEHASRQLKLYSPDCELASTITRPEGTVLCAEHVPELNQVVVTSSDLQMSFYDDTGQHRLTRSFHTPSSQICLEWAPESRTLFSAGMSGVVYGWGVDRAQPEERLRMGGRTRDGALIEGSHSDMVLDMLQLPSLEVLATASMDTTIRLWDVQSGRHKRVLQGHAKGVRSLAYSPEYRFLVSAGFDYDAVVWNPYCDSLILRLHGHTSSLCATIMIEDSPQILTADVDGVFKLWDVRTFSCLQTFSAEHSGDVTHSFVAATPHRRLVSAGRQLHIFDYEKLANPELTDDNPIGCALYNPTSTTFITAAGRDVKVWDATRGGLMRVYRGVSEADITALCLDDRQRKFIAADHAGNVVVFDYMNGTEMKRCAYDEFDGRAHTSEVSALLYIDEYKLILSASWDGSICVHDESEPEQGVLLRRIEGAHEHDVTALCYSHNLSLIASGASDNSLRVWDLEHSRLVASCVGHCSGITALTFLDPYPLLCAADTTGNICLWAVRPSRLHDQCVLRWQNSLERAAAASSSSSSSSTANDELPAPVLVLKPQCEWDRPCSCPGEACDGSCGRTVAGFRLVTGDERGMVTVWDLLPALGELAEHHIVPLRAPFRCENAMRNLRYNAADVLAKQQNQPLIRAYNARAASCAFFFQEGTPKVQSHAVRPLVSWLAHSDSVFNISLIAEPPAVLTTSFDRLVRVWSLEAGDTGQLLGTLRQGEQERRARPWRFVVDVEARRRRKLAVARTVIESLGEEGLGLTRARSPSPPAQEGAELGDKDKEDEARRAATAESQMSELQQELLLPRVPLGLGAGAGAPAAPTRRTPRLKPVRPHNAGHGVSARQVSRAMQRRLRARRG